MSSAPVGPTPGILSVADAQAYLECIQRLSRELDQAVEAIVTNSLSLLEQSVMQQQATCAELLRMSRGGASQASQEMNLWNTPVEPELEGRIEAAKASLLTLNVRYAGLLQHSGETLRLMSGLSRSFGGPMQQAPGARPALHTWCCEL